MAAAVAALWMAGPTAASADPWARLSDQVSDVWAFGGLQRPAGDFADHLHGGKSGIGGYAEAMLGHALVQAAVRDGDSAKLESGLAAIRYVLRFPQQRQPSVFEAMAMASAYNVVAGSRPDHPIFREIAELWRAWLRDFPAVGLGRTRAYANKRLVEAVAALEMLRSGVTSASPDTHLVDPGRTRRRIRRLIAALPERTRTTAGRVGAHTIRSLSDPRSNPLAYHALTTGLLGRIVELQGGSDRRAVRLLVEAVRAGAALQAPDGDLAYTGRSQGQAWALSYAALGAVVAAKHSPAQAGRFLASAGRALGRLRDVHGVGSQGFAIVPALRIDPSVGSRPLDDYAGNPLYNGLAMVGLNWALDAMEGAPAPEASLGAPPGRARGVVLPFGDGRFAVASEAPVWFSVRARPTVFGDGKHAGDLRQDFGLTNALAWRDGAWVEVVPHRPRTGAGTDSAGPILKRGGELGFPDSRRLRARPGAVQATGGFRTADGRWLRDGVTFTWRASGEGVRMSVPVRRGDAIEFSAFLTGPAHATATGARGSHQDVLAAGPKLASVSIEPGYTSAYRPHLTRARMTFEAARPGRLDVLLLPR